MSTDRLVEVFRQIEAEIPAKKLSRVPDKRFDEIANLLLEITQQREWAIRPRTWFILKRINCLDAMTSFIAQGLNDTCLPYNSRQSLPQVFSFGEYSDFIKTQDLVDSDVLGLENGKHVVLKNGDELFEKGRVTLGAGSQG